MNTKHRITFNDIKAYFNYSVLTQEQKRKRIAIFLIWLTVCAFINGYFQSYTAVYSGLIANVTTSPLRILIYGFAKWQSLFVLMCLTYGIYVYLRIKTIALDGNADSTGAVRSEEVVYGDVNEADEAEIREYCDARENAEDVNDQILGYDLNKDIIYELKTDTDFEHSLNPFVMVQGNSGAGKSANYVIPNVLQDIKAGRSVIVSDPKGELYRLIGNYAKKQGYHVRAWITKGDTMMFSDSLDLMGLVETQQDAATLASVMVRNTPGYEPNVYTSGAEKLIAFGILYVKYTSRITDDKDRTMGMVYRLLCASGDIFEKTDAKKHSMSKSERDEQIEKVRAAVEAGAKTDDEQAVDKLTYLKMLIETITPSDSAYIAKEYWDLSQGASVNLTGNIFNNVKDTLKLFVDDTVKAITQKNDVKRGGETLNNDVDLVLPAKEKCIYFVIVDDMTVTYRYLASIFFNFAFLKQVAYADSQHDLKCKIPVHYMLDELMNIGIIDNLAEKVRTVRSRGISITLVLQDIKGFQLLYGDSADSILGNCDTHICLGVGNNYDDALWWENRSGVYTVDIENESRPSATSIFSAPGNYQSTVGRGQRPTYYAAQIMNTPRSQAIVKLATCRIFKVRKFYYENHPAALAGELTVSYITDRKPLWWENYKNREWFQKQKDELDHKLAAMKEMEEEDHQQIAKEQNDEGAKVTQPVEEKKPLGEMTVNEIFASVKDATDLKKKASDVREKVASAKKPSLPKIKITIERKTEEEKPNETPKKVVTEPKIVNAETAPTEATPEKPEEKQVVNVPAKAQPEDEGVKKLREADAQIRRAGKPFTEKENRQEQKPRTDNEEKQQQKPEQKKKNEPKPAPIETIPKTPFQNNNKVVESRKPQEKSAVRKESQPKNEKIASAVSQKTDVKNELDALFLKEPDAGAFMPTEEDPFSDDFFTDMN